MKNMKKVSEGRLSTGPVQSTLIRLMLPMLLGSLSMIIFNITDTFFVSRLGTQQLAALSFIFPVVLFAGSLSHGVGMGVSAVVSHAIGENNPARVKRLTTDGLLLALIFVGAITGIGHLSISWSFHLLGVSPEVMVHIRQYMTIWYWGAVFMVVPMVANNAIRATGDTKSPSLIVLCATVVNIVLDPIFIFGIGPVPQLGVAGAAIATVMSRALMFGLALWVLQYKKKMISYEIPSFQTVKNSWRQILFIGVPTAGTKVALPIAAGVLTSIVASYGSEAVAGFGVATRIEVFTMMMILALAGAIGPFVGQNYGAGKFNRIQLGIRTGYKFSLLWGVIVTLAFAYFGGNISSIFSDDPAVISVARMYLIVVPAGYAAYGFLMIATTAMSALKKPYHAALMTLTQTFVFSLPLAYVGSFFVDLRWVFLAIPLSYVIVGFIACLSLSRILSQIELSV